MSSTETWWQAEGLSIEISDEVLNLKVALGRVVLCAFAVAQNDATLRALVRVFGVVSVMRSETQRS